MTRILLAVLLAVSATTVGVASPAATRGPLDGRPDVIVDLNSADGLSLMGGTWTFEDVSSGTGIVPVAAGGLLERRGPSGVSVAWYRTRLVMPEAVGGLSTRDLSAVFEIVVDDYAEIWVNGKLARTIGQSGGSLIAGFNAPNRVVLTRNAIAGQVFDVQVYAINGPISDPPFNYVWVRSATVDFYKNDETRRRAAVTIERKSPALDTIIPVSAALDHLATGFQFTEGPVWVPAEHALLFSDPNDNTIYRW
ncbi:MAG TPA: hypothetical protein VF491_15830, partial [Vicinamibacterales bacterium]